MYQGDTPSPRGRATWRCPLHEAENDLVCLIFIETPPDFCCWAVLVGVLHHTFEFWQRLPMKNVENTSLTETSKIGYFRHRTTPDPAQVSLRNLHVRIQDVEMNMFVIHVEVDNDGPELLF